MQRLRRSRLAQSVLVAVAVLILTSSSYAAAIAERRDWRVPEPRIGDVATYRVTLDGDWNVSGLEPSSTLAYRWRDGPVVRSHEGSSVATDVIEVGHQWARDIGEHQPWWSASSAPTEVVVEAGGAQVLGWRERMAVLWTLGDGIADTGVGSGTTLDLAGDTLELGAAAHADACLAINAWQGTRVPARGTVDFAATPCNLLGIVQWGGGGPAKARIGGFDQVAGRLAVRLDAVGALEATTLGTPADTLSLWFVAGIPYPVRVAAEAGPASLLLQLAGFQLGAERRVPHPGAGSLPLVQADASHWTVVADDGVDTVWPLSHAFLAAALDPTSPLHTFLADHPDAYVSSAESLFAQTVTGMQRRWTMDVTGEDATLSFRMAPLGCNPGRSGVSLYLACVEDRFEYSDIVQSLRRPDVPSPRDRPKEAPSLASLWEVLQAYGGAGGLPDAPLNWGFTVRCMDVEGGCSPRVHTTLRMLQTSSRGLQPRLDPPGVEEAYDVRGIRMDAGGTTRVSTTSGDVQQNHGVIPPGPAAPPWLAAEGNVAPAAGPWSGQVAAVSAAAALAAAAAWWLGPGIKGGAVGLFSRLFAPDLIRDPRRQGILEAVAAEPGIHHNALARRLALSNGALSHHVGVLVRAGHLRKARGNGYTCYFPREGAMQGVGVARSPGAQHVLDAVRARPGLSNLEVARRTGLDPGTVHYHIRRLAEAGYVDVARQGRATSIRPRG